MRSWSRWRSACCLNAPLTVSSQSGPSGRNVTSHVGKDTWFEPAWSKWSLSLEAHPAQRLYSGRSAASGNASEIHPSRTCAGGRPERAGGVNSWGRSRTGTSFQAAGCALGQPGQNAPNCAEEGSRNATWLWRRGSKAPSLPAAKTRRRSERATSIRVNQGTRVPGLHSRPREAPMAGSFVCLFKAV